MNLKMDPQEQYSEHRTTTSLCEGLKKGKKWNFPFREVKARFHLFKSISFITPGAKNPEVAYLGWSLDFYDHSVSV